MTNIFLQKINAIVKFQKLLNYEDFEKTSYPHIYMESDPRKKKY